MKTCCGDLSFVEGDVADAGSEAWVVGERRIRKCCGTLILLVPDLCDASILIIYNIQ